MTEEKRRQAYTVQDAFQHQHQVGVGGGVEEWRGEDGVMERWRLTPGFAVL